MKQQQPIEGFHHPAWAKYMLYLVLPSEQREDILGDLEEGALRVLREFGSRRARAYYVFQVITSVAWFLLQRLEQSRLVRWVVALVTVGIFGKLGLIPVEEIADVIMALLK